jgi:hypothetical protein
MSDNPATVIRQLSERYAAPAFRVMQTLSRMDRRGVSTKLGCGRWGSIGDEWGTC